MKKTLIAAFAAALSLSPLVSSVAHAEGMGQEAAEHPRIVAAIRELEQTVAYLRAAPHDFGGHKAKAIAAAEAAIRELNEALRFRAVQDTRRGK